MTIATRKEPDSLGVKFSGDAKEGHSVEITRRNALQTIFGTDDPDQAGAFLTHCLKALHADESGSGGDANDERIFMLSIIRDMAPRDPVERMLSVQTAATHVATIRTARRLACAETILKMEAYSTCYNKLARTFTAQIEALRKHRTGGKQTVVVQHVNVSDGGQAIVGNVQAGGRGTDEK